MSKIAVNEIFGPTIQGEGRYTGTPSVFVRLNGCNLRCCFGRPGSKEPSSICDTPYTSHCAEKSKMYEAGELAQEIVGRIERIGGHCDNSHIVITGGEPLLQQEALLDVLEALRDECDCFNQVTIETNGSIPPFEDFKEYGVFWSVSPKLSNSCCFEGTDVSEAMQEQHRKSRINVSALAHIVMSGDDYQLKFVYSGPETVAEILTLINIVKKEITDMQGPWVQDIVKLRLDSIDQHIMLMPEGMTNEQLSMTAPGAVQACIENGWVFCDRVHIRIWGDKRAV